MSAQRNAVKLGLIVSFICLACQQAPEKGQATPIAARFQCPDRVNDVAFSPDGRLLAAGYGWNQAGGIKVWDTARKSIVATLDEGTTDDHHISQLAFSPDGTSLAAVNFRGGLSIWQVSSWSRKTAPRSPRGQANSLEFSSDGGRILIGYNSGVFLCPIGGRQCARLATVSSKNRYFGSATFSRDGHAMMTAEEGGFALRDLRNGRKLRVFPAAQGAGFFVSITPAGDYFVGGGGSILGPKSVVIGRLPAGDKVAEIAGFRTGVFSVAISRSGKLLALGGGAHGAGGFLSLHQIPGGQEIAYRDYGQFPIEGLSFSPDDSWLAAASGDGEVVIYRVSLLKGPEVRRQGYFQCGEVAVDGNQISFVPLSKVPVPMWGEFEYAWQEKLLKPENFVGMNGTPLALLDWEVHSSVAEDKVLVRDFKALTTLPSDQHSRDHIVFGDVQNPGWNRSKILKIFSDGSFVAATNLGVCMAYGSLSDIRSDWSFEDLRAELLSGGLLEIPEEPQTRGTDHYRTRFIQLSSGEQQHLRTDAEQWTQGEPRPEGKVEKFDQLWSHFETILEKLMRAGRHEP